MSYRGDRTTGFASPAKDHVEGTIDLSDALDLRRPSRYPVRVAGDALYKRGIRHNDILIVDTAVKPWPGAIVIATVGDDTRACELICQDGGWWLRPSLEGAASIAVDAESDVDIWAVATALVRSDV